MFDIRRRDVIALLGGAAAAWAVAARAQQPGERMRRIGVLNFFDSDEPEARRRMAAFAQGLAQANWIEGRNIRSEYRWGMGDPDRLRRHVTDLVELAPDAIMASGVVSVQALQKATRTIPIVFGFFIDPVGAGIVASLSRPGGNITGFTGFEYGTSAKWLQLLKELRPALTRVAVLRDAATATGIGQWAAIQTVAPTLGVELVPINPREVAEIEPAVAAFANLPNAALIAPAGGYVALHRELIVTLAARYRLPTIYPLGHFVRSGGLFSYGPDPVEPYRHAAGYIDRILRGEKPADLPVQAPTKYELVVNLKTAKALGLAVPDTLLARADEVIE
jgi:putative tryptophan/tyrosine transport system substrate-binding protein